MTHTPKRHPRMKSFGFNPDDFDSSDATAWLADRDQPEMPKYAEAGELTDLNLLPKQFHMFARETRDALHSIGTQLLPIVNRIEASLAALVEREQSRDAHVLEIDARLDRIEQHLGLEPRPLPPLPPRPKRITMKR